MNAPAEITTPSPDYLRVLEALVQINEPAERDHIARRAGISPDGAGVQLVALAGKRIVVRCPQPKGAPALWSLAVSLSTARQMVEGMKRAAAETGPAADDRRRIIAAMREIGAPASAFGIAKKSGADLSVVSVMLEAMTADGTVQRIPGSTGQRPKFALAPSVQPRMPTATDGEPGDDEPAPEPGDTQAEDRRRAVLEALREAPEANADSIASATGLSVSEARFFLHAMAADGIVERIEHENAGSIRRNPTIWRIVDADQPGDTQAVDAVEAAPVSDHAASLDDPDNFGDDEMPAAAPDPDGWIPWHGGECPVPAGSRCSIKLRHGEVSIVDDPEDWRWGRHEDDPVDGGDIVEYRPEPELPGIATAATGECSTGGEVEIVSASDVRADWVMRHTDRPATPASDLANLFTPLCCAAERITGPLRRQADEFEADALRLRRTIAEANRIAGDVVTRMSLDDSAEAIRIALQIIEDVQE